MARAELTFTPSAVVKTVVFLAYCSFRHPTEEVVLKADSRGVVWKCGSSKLKLEPDL